MKITVSDIKSEGLEIDIIKEMDLTGDEGSQKSPVKALLYAKKDGSSVFIKGRAEATITLMCGRCLKDFQLEIDTDIDISFLPETSLAGTNEKYRLSKKELETGFYRNDEIDVFDLIREQIAINIPMKQLCSEDCAGLCDACGSNLNIRSCNCKKNNIDDRWASLKSLLIERKD